MSSSPSNLLDLSDPVYVHRTKEKRGGRKSTTGRLTYYFYSFKSSYYDKDYRAGAALLRARRPYLVKNAVTGIALFGFCVGVCMSLFPKRRKEKDHFCC